MKLIKFDKKENQYFFDNNIPFIFKFSILRYIKKYLFRFILILLIYIFHDYVLLILFKKYLNQKNKIYPKESEFKIDSNLCKFTNIDMTDDFFQIKEVIEQIIRNNLTYIETITGGFGKIGNALMIVNHLLNICKNIKCKNIIVPKGDLDKIIKKPIYYKDYNINIFPYNYINKTKIDINLSLNSIFYFEYKNKPMENKLGVLREEIINNIPKYIANPNDLYIHIRSGDVFVYSKNKGYSQPPLCFYETIIKEYKYNNIYMLSNGFENPVINKLLKSYPNIKYLSKSIENDISVIINSFNLVVSISTFTANLVSFNNNLNNIYIYEILKNYSRFFRELNCTLHIMKPSLKYIEIMQYKWEISKEQIELMLNETCDKNSITSISKKY